MTVQELIELLKKEDQDKKIYLIPEMDSIETYELEFDCLADIDEGIAICPDRLIGE